MREIVSLNEKYFNLERINKYICSKEYIGEDVFYIGCKIDWDKYWGLKENYGFRKTDIDTFIRRSVFYFFFDEITKESINIFFDVYPIKMDDVVVENIYKCLEYLYYDCGYPVSEIIEYVKKIKCKNSLYDALLKWADYIRLCKKYNISKYKPINFIFEYNIILEKDHQKPIVYFFDRYDNNKYYIKNGKNIKFKGYIPLDSSGNPKFEWLGFKFISMDLISANVDYTGYGEIEFATNYKSICKIFNKSINGLTCQLVYAASKYLEISGESLFKFRKRFHYSRNDVEKICGINIKSLENWEKNIRTPNGSDLIKLINLYEIDNIYDLLDHKYILNYLDDSIEFGQIFNTINLKIKK